MSLKRIALLGYLIIGGCNATESREVSTLEFNHPYHDPDVDQATKVSWAMLQDEDILSTQKVITDITVCMSLKLSVITSHFIMESMGNFR